MIDLIEVSHVVQARLRRLYGVVVVALAATAGCQPGPVVLSPFGSQLSADRTTPRAAPHSGVDIEAYVGDEVLAAADGVVVAIVSDSSEGTTIEIKHDTPHDAESHGASYVTAYSHLASTRVGVGRRVARGETIGIVGLFSASAGVAHVHWQLCLATCGPATTLDPLTRSHGCHRRARAYSVDSLELTLPVKC